MLQNTPTQSAPESTLSLKAQYTLRALGPVKKLPEGTVLVFDTALSGFHGCGNAGLAMRGVSANTWRNDKTFLETMNQPRNLGPRQGLRAVLGISRGWMTGTHGEGYGIATFRQSGSKRSVPLEDIQKQIENFLSEVNEHPELHFVVLPIGVGQAGYTPEEMDEVWEAALKGWPRFANLEFQIPG